MSVSADYRADVAAGNCVCDYDVKCFRHARPYKPGKPVAVVVDGPEPDWDDRRGEEYAVWTVAVTDDDGEAVGRVYTVHSHAKAMALGRRMATDRRLEYVNDSSPA